MIRLTNLSDVAAHRTISPLYEQHQATLHATFLDPAETADIYSGMVAVKSGEDIVKLLDGALTTHQPFGLFALDRNDTINDYQGLDVEPTAVFQSDGTAEFFVDSPAFNDAVSYSVPTTGVPVALFAGTSTQLGKLTSASPGSGAIPVCELLEVVSDTRLRVRLLAPGTRSVALGS